MRRQKKQSIIRLLLITELIALILVAGFFVHSYNSANKEEIPESQTSTEIEEVNDADELLATLFLASDYQYESGWDQPRDTLEKIIDVAIADGKKIDGMIMCGDYTNEYKKYDYQVSPEQSISEISSLTQSKCPSLKSEDILFVQGNHDALTESISETGLHEYKDYLVYVLNTQNDFPWCQGKTSGSLDKVKRSSAEMKSCFDELIEAGETRPIIIAGHVPIHFTARTSSRHTTGDNLYSSLVFDVVNEAGKSLDIIYLFGHNHSKGWDCYLGGGSVYKQVGDTLLVPRFDEKYITTDDYSEEKLNFTYMNTGYVGYYMNCGEDELANGSKEYYDAADMALTGTTFELYPDHIVLTRYDTEGVHDIGGEGCANPYKNYIDKGLIPETSYSKTVKGPQTIERQHSSKN